jgi:hypothetical protein
MLPERLNKVNVAECIGAVNRVEHAHRDMGEALLYPLHLIRALRIGRSVSSPRTRSGHSNVPTFMVTNRIMPNPELYESSVFATLITQHLAIKALLARAQLVQRFSTCNSQHVQ